MTETLNLHIAVVGGGPGGYAAAFLAADLGLKVTLIDPEANPGGVCLYRGCIPSKALLHVAKLIDESRHAKNWGIEYADPKIDLSRLRSWKEGVVQKLTGGLGILSKQRKVEYIQGRAAVENSNTLRISKAGGGEESRTFDRIILATGSRPAIIPAFKLDTPRVMDSTSALDLNEVPGTLLVVGGGYIGLELGTVYAALGSKVSVVEMLSGLLPGADRDLVLPLHKRIEKSFASIMLNTTVAAMKVEANGIRVTFDGPEVKEREQVFEKVLVSVGRKPNSEIPGLDKTLVQIGPRGFIQVNRQLQTGGHSGGRVHRSRDRLVRPHRNSGSEGKPGNPSREISLGRIGPGHDRGPYRSHDQAHPRHADRARAGRGNCRRRRRRTYRRRRAGGGDGRSGQRHRLDHSPASNTLRNRDGSS